MPAQAQRETHDRHRPRRSGAQVGRPSASPSARDLLALPIGGGNRAIVDMMRRAGQLTTPGPVERAAPAPRPIAVQRVRWGNPLARSGGERQRQTPLTIGKDTVQTSRIGRYYRFATPQGGHAYVYDGNVENDVVEPRMAAHVHSYLRGALTLYRGISRWHPLWHEATGSGVIPPLGKGELPDFASWKSSFIPFAPNVEEAHIASTQKQSHERKQDQLRFVEGYDPQDPEFAVGALFTVKAPPSRDVGFLTLAEIQARGPVPVESMKMWQMSTDIGVALGDEPRGTTFGQGLPEKPSHGEKEAYRQEFGTLRP